MSSKKLLIGYAFAIFISSAVLMVLEIVAGRLLAPYIGVSMYTWTSIIGIILAGLSLGNWAGGHWADRAAGHREAGLTLFAAGISALAILYLLTLIAPMLQTWQMSLMSASFLYVCCLFFIPATLLGVITPLLTTMALKLDTRTGHIVGRMHALAALGSIAGTFAAGFWLIQYFGAHTVIITVAVILMTMAVPFLLKLEPVPLAVIVFVSASCTLGTISWKSPPYQCDEESLYYCIRVVDASDAAPSGQARAMVLDHLLHSINHRFYPELLISPYVHLMDEMMHLHLGNRIASSSFFFAGGGAYTQPRAMVHRYPEARVVVSELDPEVTRIAREKLFVDTAGMQVLHTDARPALETLNDSAFDVIVGDVFHDVTVPYHLTTVEYARLIRQRLKQDGLYVMNVVDVHPDPRLVGSLVKTLREVFSSVDVWLEQTANKNERETYVISATDARAFDKVVHARQGIRRNWQNVTATLLTPEFLASLPILTDDYTPVDRLLARLSFTTAGN